MANMLPRNRNSRFHRRMVSARPRLGGLTLSFYSLTLFMLITGGQVSVSHSAPIPGRYATKDFIEKEVQNPSFSQFEEKMREAAAANSQEETDVRPLTVLRRMIADLAHVQNELVLMLVALALVLYFVALAWIASSQSKNKGKSKKKLQHFGNKGSFKPYLITLRTGMLPGSGCKTDVLMKLSGTSGSTQYYNLSRMSRESGRLNPCRRGAQAAFVIWTRNIGDLISVQIQLDNHHIRQNPKWLPDFIRVTDCQEEIQRTWLINKQLTGAGSYILHIQSSRIQAASRYMAVNLLKGFSRFSLWNAWTLLKEDTSLGAISSLCLCLLFTLSQMALSSILLYQLPHLMPTSPISPSIDTWQQTLESYGLSMSYKDTLLMLAAGTVTITVCIWVIETLLRFVPRSSSGLTKRQLKHIKKTIKKSKYEEDSLNGKFDAVMKKKVKQQRDMSTTTPALVAQDGKDKTSPSDKPSTSVADKDTDKKVESPVNLSGNTVCKPVGGEMNSGKTSEIEDTVKKTPTLNQGQTFANRKKDALVSAYNNPHSGSSPCSDKEEPTQDTKKNQLAAQGKQVLNANVEEFKNAEQIKEMKTEKSNDLKIPQSEPTANKPVGNIAQTVNEKVLLPNNYYQKEQVKQAETTLAKQYNQTVYDQQDSEVMPSAKDTADLKELAFKEKKVPPQHEGMIYAKGDNDQAEQMNDSKIAEKADVDTTNITNSLLNQEKDSIPSGENESIACDINHGRKAGTDTTSDGVTESDTSSTDDKQVSEDEPVIQYVNEIQPPIRRKKRKNIISKMGKAFKGLKRSKSQSNERGIMVESTSPCQSCVVNIEPTVYEKEANTDPAGHNPCILTYEKEKTPIKKVWHKLKKISSTSLLQNKDKMACPCPSETKTIPNENKEKESMVDHNTEGVASKSCAEIVAPGSVKDVEKQEEENPVLFSKEVEPDEPVPLPSVEQEEERPMASKELQSDGPIPPKHVKEPQSDQSLPCEEKQTGGASLSTDMQANRSLTEEKKAVEAQQISESSSVDHVAGQKEVASSAQQADGPAMDKDRPADELPTVEDQPVNGAGYPTEQDAARGSTDVTVPQHPVDTKPDVDHKDGGNISPDKLSDQQCLDGTRCETETKIVHKCDNAFFSQHSLDKIKKKIVKRMLFHVGKVVNEKQNVSQHSIMHKVSVALNKASCSSAVYKNILGMVSLEVQSAQESWKSSCYCGLIYQIGCHVLKRAMHMKEATGLDEVALDKKVLGTALDVACYQEAKYIVEEMTRNKHHNTLGANIKPSIPEEDSGNRVFGGTKKDSTSAAAKVEMAGKLPNRENCVESTDQSVSPKPSAVSFKGPEIKSAVASSTMDDEEKSSEKHMKKKQKLEACTAHRHGKKRSNKNQNCSADEPATDAFKDLEMVTGEANKQDSKLKIGYMLVDREYVDQALLTIDAELAGTTPSHIPAFLGYVIYVLLTLLCVVATGVSVLFGAALNPHQALVWLVYTAAGLACHIMVLEPLKVLVIVFFSSVRRQYII